MKAVVEASRSLEGVEHQIEEYLEEAEPLLRRGAPSGAEGARIEDWAVEGSTLKLHIVSDRYVRAHDALFRLRRMLAEKLGKNHRIGVRRIKILDYVVEGLPEVEESKAESILSGLGSISQSEKGYTLRFHRLEEQDLESRVVDRALKLLLAEAKPEAEKPKGKLVPLGYVLRSSSSKPVRFRDDIVEYMVKAGWAKRYPGRGQWIFTAPLTALLSALKSLVLEKILKPLDFQEWMLPKLTPLNVIARMPGYLDHLAEGMIYCVVPPRSEDALQDFKRSFMLKKEVDLDLLRRGLEGPLYVLEPAQCTPFYQFFSGEYVEEEDLPVKVYDQSGWTWRWEGKAVRGLERTIEFYRLEAVWLASREDAVELRDRIAEESFKLADRDLDLEVRLVVGAPFYMTGEEAARSYVDISTPEGYPTVDLEAWLPYRGSREESEWLEIGAYTCAQDKYVRSFGIREVKGRSLWTGCAGFGLTRWVTAFLAQHGFNFEDWPKPVKDVIGSLPKPPPVKR